MGEDFNKVWPEMLRDILCNGNEVAPRGRVTSEVLHKTICVDTRLPVLLHKERKLSYQFMAAEAYWILSGDNSVEGIEPWNKHIAQFSDNGETFFGAYGPKIYDQIKYVCEKLMEDPNTRQAGLTIWRENPPETKDVPCTVAIFFSIRNSRLNAHVFMRSSDAWLGVPYDVFNFSMLTHLVCGHLNVKQSVRNPTPTPKIIPGDLYLTMASSHLYYDNFKAAEACVKAWDDRTFSVYQPEVPDELYENYIGLLDTLNVLRNSKKDSQIRWWNS